MLPLNKLVRYGLIGCFSAMVLLGGCTKRPSQDELARLEEARTAAEAAENKLAELKRERMELEATLQQKQEELKKREEERDDVKQKMGK
jgi:hypothetical protein